MGNIAINKIKTGNNNNTAIGDSAIAGSFNTTNNVCELLEALSSELPQKRELISKMIDAIKDNDKERIPKIWERVKDGISLTGIGSTTIKNIADMYDKLNV